jgi:hypothetical protein
LTIWLNQKICHADKPILTWAWPFITGTPLTLQVLTHQSGMGRPVEGDLRELTIARRRSGYLTRYEFEENRVMVLVARIRHQCESGYQDEL